MQALFLFVRAFLGIEGMLAAARTELDDPIRAAQQHRLMFNEDHDDAVIGQYFFVD
jgi:hypothetical protein